MAMRMTKGGITIETRRFGGLPPRVGRYLGAIFGLTMFGLALYALHHVLTRVQIADALAHFRETPLQNSALSLLCVGGSYFALTGYDVIALRHIDHPLPYPKAALASFTSYAFSNNFGFALLTGGGIRYRIYSAAGLSTTEIATLIGLCAVTFGLAAASLLGTAMMLEPARIAIISTFSPALAQVLGFLLFLLIAGYALTTALRRSPVRFGNWSFAAPRLTTTLAQLAVGAADLCLAAAALYVLLPADASISLPAFVGIFVAAITLGVLSDAPGGLGVFEVIMLLALPQTDRAALVGALVMFRGLYYLLPLAFAALLLAGRELYARRAAMAPAGRVTRDITYAVAPQLIGATVFMSGALLLFAATMPVSSDRLSVLRGLMPLPFVEISHLLGSVVGLALMIVAAGLFRRLRDAFWLAAVLLATGIIFLLTKGLQVEPALALVVVFGIVLVSRNAFYRQGSLLSQPFSAGWVATITVFLAGWLWIGFFAFRHVAYTDAVWWQFAYRGDAPRFLRASIAVTVLAVTAALVALLRAGRPRATGDDVALDTLRRIIALSPRTDAHLALSGDKRFLLAEGQDAFLMYQRQGRSWVSLGDPVGTPGAWDALLWRFRRLCDHHDGWPVFYQVPLESLPFYIDHGLTLSKLGEEGRVDLATFSLQDSRRRELRQADRRGAREGLIFEIVAAADLPPLLPELRAVSDEWLTAKHTHEKRFSVGAFSETYIGNFDCAVIRRGDRLIAFANILRGQPGGKVTIDLMRYRRDAPHGTMDFLFVRLMLWGKAQGYQWFGMGMAPLAGLETDPLGPVWNRIGAFVFQHGEHFYNFEGLRAYKQKFDPVWEPKYLVSPGGLALPQILINVTALIAGGTLQILRR